MRRLFFHVLVTTLVGMSAGGCVSVASLPGVLDPALTSPIDQSSGPAMAVENPTPGPFKQGEACATNVLMLFSWGDASIAGAARTAGIVAINSVSYETSSLLFFVYRRYCTHVEGTS